MAKFIGAAIVVLALGTSAISTYHTFDAIQSQSKEIATLRSELDDLRSEHAESDSSENDGLVSGVAMDRTLEDDSEGSPETASASTGESRRPAPANAWIETISEDDERLEQLASLVKTRLTEAPPVETREEVREQLQVLRDEEEQERNDRRRDMMAERTREQVKGYADRLDLYPAEEEEMTKILVNLSEERFDFFRRAREGEEAWSGIREKMQEMSDASDVELKEILTEDQFAEYDKIREEERAQQGWGWGRNRNNNNNNGDTNNTNNDNQDSNGDSGAGN